jgi:hypothetical protein
LSGPNFVIFPVNFPVSREFWSETGPIQTATSAKLNRFLTTS